MILVPGATGTTGGEVARQLIAAGEKVRLLVRNPAKAREFGKGAGIVEGDLDRKDSLVPALTFSKWHARAVADGVERATGRKAGSFEAWARRNAAAFR